MKIPRQKMPEQEPEMRRENFFEVNLGLTAEMAKLEALRCLQCPKPRCVDGCPVGIQISDFIALVAEGKFDEAVKVVKRDNLLPAICGRVCPQEEQCEVLCVLAKKGEPVAIGNLERFVADFERDYGLMKVERLKVKKTGKRVAVVGSGPAGLACASDLIRMGHDVTVFEALHALGGVLVYGIPEFRLPKEIVHAEIDQLRKMGVEFRTNAVIGRTDTVDELLANGYDAVFLGVGAGAPRFLDIPGENLIGVYSANEFLTRVNLMRAYLPESETPVYDCSGKEAAVFGGGNTAMDAVRTSLRLGAKSGRIIYRRSEKEMPARKEEIHHAKEEGVKFLMLTNPVEFLGDENGWLVGVRVQKMELGEPDASGRRRPVPVKGSDYVILCQMAIVAIGNSPNPIIQKTTPEIVHTKWGTVVADDRTGRTTKRGVFAGGDIVTGGATVILALGAGRRAAKSIDEFLRTGEWEERKKEEPAAT
ncbi:MAG: NADPH-dependent glutamate synthase [Candidatus Eisenbacteria bacterium]|nr:NADPH-dependent glutamate synthase [Candidatus Eisenbacteria bacterium]